MVGPSLAYDEFERAVESERTKRRRLTCVFVFMLLVGWVYFAVALTQARHETRKATGEIVMETVR
jgi:uncharacterized membrane protein YsdA (DUF1294 family)